MKTKMDSATRDAQKKARRRNAAIVEWSLDPKEGAGKFSLLASCGRGDNDVSFDEPEERR